MQCQTVLHWVFVVSYKEMKLCMLNLQMSGSVVLAYPKLHVSFTFLSKD